MPNDLNDLFQRAAKPPSRPLDVDALHRIAVRRRKRRLVTAAASMLLLMVLLGTAVTRTPDERGTDVVADEGTADTKDDGGDDESLREDTTSTSSRAEDTTASPSTTAAAGPAIEPITTTTVVRCPRQGGPPQGAHDLKSIAADFDGDGAADTLYSYSRPDLELEDGMWLRITLANGDAAERSISPDFAPYGAPNRRTATPLGAADLFGDGRAIAFLWDAAGPDSSRVIVPYFWSNCEIGTVERDGVTAAWVLLGGQYSAECGRGADGIAVIERQQEAQRAEPGYAEYRSAWPTRDRVERIDRGGPSRFVETTDYEPLHHFRCGGLTLSHYPE